MKPEFVFENFFLFLLRIRFQRNNLRMKVFLLFLHFSLMREGLSFRSKLDAAYTSQFSGVMEEKTCVVGDCDGGGDGGGHVLN